MADTAFGSLLHAVGRVLAVRQQLPDKHWELQDALDDLEAVCDMLPAKVGIVETPAAPARTPVHRWRA